MNEKLLLLDYYHEELIVTTRFANAQISMSYQCISEPINLFLSTTTKARIYAISNSRTNQIL